MGAKDLRVKDLKMKVTYKLIGIIVLLSSGARIIVDGIN